MFSAQVIERIAKEVSASPDQVSRTIALLNSGYTIPFLARYRKDATGGLDEARLESIESRNHYFIALEQRKRAALANIGKLGQLTEELRTAVEACLDKGALDDLYLPFRRKHQTRATLGVAKGLAPLAEFIWSQGAGAPEDEASRYVVPVQGVKSAAEALQGAQDILAERISEDVRARGTLRARMREHGTLRAHSTKASDGQKTKYTAFYDYTEPLHKVPAHRLLAILRGNREGALRIELALDDAALKNELASLFIRDEGSPSAAIVRAAVNDAYDRLLRPVIEFEVMTDARAKADDNAIAVFRENVKSLLMAPPAGPLVVLGVSSCHRPGCRFAVVDAAGTFVDAATVSPDQDADKRNEARAALVALVRQYGVQAVAVGNGAGCREAMAFVRESLGAFSEGGAPFVALVSEAGASVYAASKLAQEEHPDLEMAVRSAVSIARRLQDPLSELVKIEPRSIGVGQYQHDVNQKRLREGLYQTVSHCVNEVGVDVNAAPASLLRYVAGIQYGTAQNIVESRLQKGGFKSREELAEIAGIGPKTYEQCAGFLRIKVGSNPLDNTAVHPEAYELVGRMAAAAGVSTGDLIGNTAAVHALRAEEFVSDTAGPLMVRDILKELAHPRRDPRRRFRAAKFDENVRSIQDLSAGQELEGMVTNVTDFGAFVDLGVGQDGLVHLSELSHRYVRDPRRVVHVGESVRVKVIGVEKEPSRISLSMKALEKEPKPRPAGHSKGSGERGDPRASRANGDRPRAARPEARPGGGEGQRPVREDRHNARRGDRRKDRNGEKDRKPRRVSEDAKAAKSHGDTKAPLNTLLADQLAALRDSLGIGT